MSLCNVCRLIPFRKFITTDLSRGPETTGPDGFKFNAAGRTSRTASNKFPWQDRRCTFAEIVSRAKTCSLCAYILLLIRQKRWEKLWERGTFFAWEEVKDVIPRNLMVYLGLPSLNHVSNGLEIQLGTPRRRETLALSLYLRSTLENCSLKNRGSTPVIFRETLHPEPLNRMLSWFDKCNISHSECADVSTRTVPLPTRVLDIRMLPGREQMLGKHQEWRDQFQGESCKLLQASKGQTGQYAALSYCWGVGLPLTTTTTNLRDHESAIDFDRLPRTLQDAIMVVRYLGIEYIWIDCLCILQDSKADWEQEAAHMADVYSNAYLTIAASRAGNCGEGFLGPRERESPLAINIEDENGSFELYLQPCHERYEDQSQPLNTRGWAIQESLLSHRVLSFDTWQMTWRCAFIQEEEKEITPRGGLFPHGYHISKIAKHLKDPMSPEKFGYSCSAWAYLTRDYTLREVTYDSDTFPAIAGIVQKVQKLTGDTYYAGLWRSQFLEGLLWHYYRFDVELAYNIERDRKPRNLMKRQVWTAPSWSWASVKGSISYHYWVQTGLFHPCARLDECNITRSGLDPFGAITAGYARITGPVTLITDVEAEDYSSSLHPLCKLQLGNGTFAKAQVMFDLGPRESCVVLMVMTYIGICIEKVEKTKDTYIRVGTVEITGGYEPIPEPGYLTASDHCPPRTITLI